MNMRTLQVIPILRIFSVEKMRVLSRLRRLPSRLGAPIRALHAELSDRNYPYWRPGITETFWGTEQLNLLDPLRQ
jgi:hypothetical protein